VDQIGGELLGKDADHNDSFEKYYNKDLDLEEGKAIYFDNCSYRPGTHRDLWTKRVSNKLYILRVVWKGPDASPEGAHDARTNSSQQKPAWPVCLLTDCA
jgi:hypothetical protein